MVSSSFSNMDASSDLDVNVDVDVDEQAGEHLANALWVAANTKKCPRCSAAIEKDEGCNHMSCRKCRHEFCWICMQDWTLHSNTTGGYFQCNRFDASAAKSEREGGAEGQEQEGFRPGLVYFLLTVSPPTSSYSNEFFANFSYPFLSFPVFAYNIYFIMTS
jgi:IBR domain, a half RING-finger domain